MAVKYPKAEWRPLGKQIQPTMSGHDIIVIHTMAQSLASTDSGFKVHGYRGLEAHFGTGQHGELYQWQDLARTADACYHGNDVCISIENEDPLEAGLEIIARPPGKKPATLSLLSGGEQALTALALIFAVFLTNPAPICVLDEVDAPLDDYNVERFCDLLEAMRKRADTRFVAITHNPVTMSRMDRLFGVTMAERGVSQLVSVELAQAQEFAEAG